MDQIKTSHWAIVGTMMVTCLVVELVTLVYHQSSWYLVKIQHERHEGLMEALMVQIMTTNTLPHQADLDQEKDLPEFLVAGTVD